MKRIFLLAMLWLGVASYCQEPCGSDQFLNTVNQLYPENQARLDATDKDIYEYIKQRRGKKSTTPDYTIPVVVYVVHSGSALGSGTNISDAQVQSQLAAANSHLQSSGIKLCLATRRGTGTTAIPTAPGAVQNTPGIIHVNNASASNSTLDGASLDALISATGSASIAPGRYLRIYVLESINGTASGILGLGSFPNMPLFDGILMRYDAFGDVSGCSGCNLLASNNQGKVFTHELGHYLKLYHTFQGSCSGVNDGTFGPNGVPNCNLYGDKVCDTPQGAMLSGCPGTVSACPNDVAQNVHNYMQYTNDACRNLFTAGQNERMYAALNLERSILTSTDNLIYTGICNYQNLISSTFSSNTYQICANGSVTFTPLLVSHPNTTYSWNFGDGTPNASGTTGANHQYTSTSGSPYTATLTLTRNGITYTSSVQIYVSPCTQPIPSASSNWYLSSSNGLKFGSGVPVVDNTIPAANQIFESASVASSGTGSVLFYTNGVRVWKSDHTLLNASSGSYVPLKGNVGSQNGAVIVPVPNSTSYYIFTKGSHANGINGNTANTLDGFRYTQINISGTTPSMPVASMNVPVTPLPGMTGFLQGNNNAMYGGHAIYAMQKCGGYWIFTTLRKSSSEIHLVVFSLTSTGLTYSSSVPVPIQDNDFNNNETIKVSPDGNKLIYQNNNKCDLIMFDFNKFAGTLSNQTTILPWPAYLTESFAFSPNSKLLYVSDLFNALYQINLDSPNPFLNKKSISGIANRAMMLGPDNKIYFMDAMKADKFSLSVIHYPDNIITDQNPNACGYSAQGPVFENTIMHNNVFTGLPNNVLPIAGNSISAFATGCNSYKFFPNVGQASCYSSFKWNFGDPASGLGNISSLTTPTHTFANPGTYTVTLTSNTNIFIAQTTVTISALPAPQIFGNTFACTTENPIAAYSTNLLDGQTVVWTATNGTIVGFNNDAYAEVNWTSLPGTVTATVTNASGCTASTTQTISSSCGCTCLSSLQCTFMPMGDNTWRFRVNIGTGAACTNLNLRYVWTFGDGFTTTTTTNTVYRSDAFTQPAQTYSVVVQLLDAANQVICSNTCGVTQSGSRVGTDGKNLANLADFTVYPNPSNGRFTLSYSGDATQSEVTIVDMVGKTVYTGKHLLETRTEINAPGLAKGTYLLIVKTPLEKITRKILID